MSVRAGSTTDFGDFTNSLLDISGSGYPSIGAGQTYTEFGPLSLGQFAGDTGRIAFHYILTDTQTQGSHIAVDDISVVIVPVPEPSILMLLSGSAIVLIACVFRQRRRRPMPFGS